jgi:endonuclease/exonuclease/phosphatase (EEP) superfamily protein YafD
VSHLGELASDGTPLWSRDCVELHASAGDRRLVLVGSHLVSRLTDLSGARRLEQAGRLREIADEATARDPGALLLAGGDLNDEPGSASLAPLLGDGEWLDPLAEAGLGETWTWLGLGGGARLDYLLLPRGQGWRAVSVAVLDGEDVFEASDHRPVVVDLTRGW